MSDKTASREEKPGDKSLVLPAAVGVSRFLEF